jgi:pSer/pThr/pTyr-binding forkhead associated (FHA) protein
MDHDGHGGEMKLGVVDVLDRDGHTRLVAPVWRWPITVGRAIDCDVVLDDVHVAPVHATITETDGVLTVLAGDTINGVRLDRRRIAAHQVAELPPGSVLEIGATRLRVRRTSDALVPERPLALDPSYRRIVLLFAAFIAWNVAEFWLNADPGVRVTDYFFP